MTTTKTPVPTSHPPLRRTLRALAMRVHFLAGLAVAPFLVVLCLTGFAYAFTPQLNSLLYGQELYVDRPVGTQHPVSEQVAAAVAARPDGTVLSVITPPEADRTTQVELSVPGLASGGEFSSEALTVYVDPYTNTVTGQLVTKSGEPPAQRWLRDLHGDLHLGDTGRLYSEFVASWLPIIITGGLILWLSRRRREGRLLIPRLRNRSGRPRLRGVHGAIGLWLALGLLAVSITGLTWSNYAGGRVDLALDTLDGRRPDLAAAEVSVPAGVAPIDLDKAVRIARAEGLQGELTITPPEDAAIPYVVEETATGLPIQKDSIAIDPYRAEVTERVGWQDYPLLAKLTTLGIQAHSGTLLGFVNQLAMALLAVGALVMLTLGYRMWWHRRPSGAGVAPTPPPVWHKLSQPVVFVIVLATAALGWAAPVLGVSLAAFLAADAGLHAIRRRRSG